MNWLIATDEVDGEGEKKRVRNEVMTDVCDELCVDGIQARFN